MRAIVVEDVLMAVFGLIPARQYEYPEGEQNDVKKPEYHFGDAKECNAFIIRMNRDVYPLIYQISTQETQQPKSGSVSVNLELVIATLTDGSKLNDERWATSYKNILMPLVDNIYQALNESGIVMFTDDYNEYELEKRPNYSGSSTKDANAFIDIVDAVIFRASIIIKNRPCLNKNIKFNT